MKLSERFELNKTQFELDFVDIDLSTDIPLFIDPYFLAQRNDPWSISASRTIRSFFQQLINLIRAGSTAQARELFIHLGEPNETCLGLSQGVPQGRGVGAEDSDKIFESLLESAAVQSGIVEDIEDCRVFVPGIDKDKTSDMATNIIRKHLIKYTQNQCRLWGMPLQENVPSGYVWERHSREWINDYTEMFVVDGRKILLTPKAIVSFVKDYTANKYLQHFVLNFLQNEHLRLNTALVQRRIKKDGSERRWVTKKSIREHEHPITKEFLAKFTQDHPEIFAKFRKETAIEVTSLKNEDLTPEVLNAIIDYLIFELTNTPPGNENATRYHRLTVGILELIFYPNLTSPQVEREIHDGRKRIDITFDNAASFGFFHRLHTTYNTPAQYIFIECKNYSRDVANPELDQLSGRFSLHKGKFGLLLCRTIDDLNVFLARCADTYTDGRGIIIPLVDDDLISLLKSLKERVERPEEVLLNDRFRNIALQ